MTLTVHIAVGSAIGLATGEATPAFLLGFVSHHVVDVIPHSDPGSSGATIYTIMQKQRALTFALLDILCGSALFLFVMWSTDFSWPVFLGILGATLPDLIDNSPFWSPFLRKYFPIKFYHDFHETVHYTIMERKYLWVGVITQLVVAGAAITFFVLK